MDARAAGELHGIQVVTRFVRARNAGEGHLLRRQRSRQAEIVVLGSPRRNGRGAIFGKTVDYGAAPFAERVMVAAAPQVKTAAVKVAAL